MEHSWLAVTESQALRFFFEHLRDVSDDSGVQERELWYNASVLAHFATISSASTGEHLPTPTTLHCVFNLFVLDHSHHGDPEIMEIAASQCLLFTGFFATQSRRRHNLGWYARLGAGFYDQASRAISDRSRAKIMRVMAVRFDFWRQQQMRLAEELRKLALPLEFNK